ncbi:sulfotransferase [Knoellia sp. CPCC 206453]|uniref:sulfotransferase n=1 Tax=Knoellia pratensis TaxID=3404796 RepID=UPI0036147985
MSRRPIRVLYVGGAGRSGTTIVSTILGQSPGVFAAGELRYAWERGFDQDHRCGCGEQFSRCPVWTRVVDRAFGVDGPPDPVAVHEDLLRRLRTMRIPLGLVRSAVGRSFVPYHRHDATIHRLYAAVAELDGVDVIVDSSKSPVYALLLSRLPDVELTMLTVVRDPRAGAHSWRRTKPTGDRDDGATMERLEIWRSALVWTVWYTLLGHWFPAGDRHLVMRYEDFVAQPETSIQRVLDRLGRMRGPEFGADGTVRLEPTHTVAGNPNRHSSGLVRLALDDEWRTSMPWRDRALGTLLTLPLLGRHGYRIGGLSFRG